ncbi:hypothetical protein CYMTET_42202 [Cymbomonas tetramitiformis]|uniref:Uncharacterized protein n=1 Tax=Cymbomonas tetramitiformis TaxID=36881 RepID=A0AAE0C4J8_9CHLO|nr:hypothetical protein CYMTET_42202 [Cymbomonas tetramitiformis]
MALDQNAESTYWAPECTDQNGNWWIKFTISQHETMLGVGLMPYGDRIHDVIDYDVFRCDAQPITSAHLISASCTELMKKCNATIGQTSEQTCEGWGPHTVGPDFGLRIRSTGGMVEPLLPHGLPYLYEVYWYGAPAPPPPPASPSSHPPCLSTAPLPRPPPLTAPLHPPSSRPPLTSSRHRLPLPFSTATASTSSCLAPPPPPPPTLRHSPRPPHLTTPPLHHHRHRLHHRPFICIMWMQQIEW